MAEQIAFDLPPRAALGREDFFVTPANARALAAIDGWRGWPGGKLALIGPAGSGKTHLAHVWADDAGAAILPAAALPGADVDALARRGAVAVEDADTLPRTEAAERALLHLHNHLLAAGGRLLLTAARPPARWPVALPDLASRMQATPTAPLEPPDDALLSAVLVKLFADRQVIVGPHVIPYLVARMERSLAGAGALVAALDRRALARARAVTRALAAEYLDGPEAPQAGGGPGGTDT
jgi:chromosomal replication initiation ATPase DnaA